MEIDNVSHFNTLKDWILDEGKLVTYLTVSKDLCIHINNSKVLLNNFVKSIRQEQPNLELNVNYLVSGLMDDNKISCRVCSENKLNELKNILKVIFFVHVYSINKGSPKDNIAALTALSTYDDFGLCMGAVKNSVTVKRSNEEIQDLKRKVPENLVDTKPYVQRKKPTTDKNPKGSKSESNLPNGSDKTEIKAEKEIKKEPLPVEQTPNKQSNTKSSNQKGITGFFNKQNGAKKKETTKNHEEVSKPPKIVKEEKNTSCETMDVDDLEIKVKKENGVTDENKVLNHIKKNSKVDKKRKRVLRVSDSESEDENDPFVADSKNESMHESDDEIPPTPAANNLKITTGIVNPRKKRKVVDKTYMSDDGYIITKREEVYESCSDSENIVENSNNVEKPIKKEIKEKLETSPENKSSENKISQKKKKVSPPQKGKQPTLMNFFKKK